MPKKRLPGTKKTLDEILAILDDYLSNNYPSNYHTDLFYSSDEEIDIKIYIGTTLNPAVITLQKRQDGTISFAIRKNGVGTQEYNLAAILREGLNQACGIGHPLDSNDVYENVSEEDYKLLISYFDSTPHLSLTKQSSSPLDQWYQYTNESGDLLTVHYYPSTSKLMAQTGSQELSLLFDNALSTCTNITPTRKSIANHNSFILAFREDTALSSDLKNCLGSDLIDFVRDNNLELYESFESAFRLRREKRTMESTDYSPMVQSICRCYEGFLKTMFDMAGLPLKKRDGSLMFISQYFYKDYKHKFFSFDKHYLKGMSITDRDKLGKAYLSFFEHRPSASHGAEEGAHKIIPTYTEADSIFRDMVNSIKVSFTVLLPYCK